LVKDSLQITLGIHSGPKKKEKPPEVDEI